MDVKVKKILYIILGCIGVGLGAVGAVLPLLPAFPFLLLAAFSFAKSSKRLHSWFISTKLYKNNLESYVKGRGMTWKTKIRIMVIVTLTMSVGFIMMSRIPVGRIILACVWVFHVLYFVFKVKTIHKGDEKGEYSHCRVLKIEGMHCEQCAKRLECAFHEHEYMKAKVDFPSQTATVYLKQPVDNGFLIQIVKQAGYHADQVC